MSSPGLVETAVDGTRVSEEASDRLHRLKNVAIRREEGVEMDFPAYRYQPFPAAVYGPWTDATRSLAYRRVAASYGLDLNKEVDARLADEMMPKWDSALVKDERELADMLAKGWCEKPDQVEEKIRKRDEHIADLAAVRAFDDQHMSPKARDEQYKADVAHGEHLLDLPAPKKRPGRPKKIQTPAEA